MDRNEFRAQPHGSRRRDRYAAPLVLAASLAVTGCGLTDADHTVIDAWLVCIECSAGEREALRDLAARNEGPTLDRLSSALLDGPSDVEQRRSEQQLSAGYAKLAAPAQSGRDYVDRHQRNFVASYQKRAALALGDAGGPVAEQVLRTALLEASRYRADVVRVIRSTLISITLAGPPDTVRITSGTRDTAPAGTTVPGPRVRVVDANGNPKANVTVIFTVIAGGGSLITMGAPAPERVALAAPLLFGIGSLELQGTGPTPIFAIPADPVTNSSGMASSGNWELGPSAGVNRIEARVGTLTDTAFAVGAGPPDTLTDFRGDNQSAPAGTPVVIDPAVRVTDETGTPVAGVLVSFSVSFVGAPSSVHKLTRLTDRNGIAHGGGWTLVSAPVLNLLVARAIDVNGVTLTNSDGAQIVATLSATGTGVGAGVRFLLADAGGIQPPTDASSYVTSLPAVRVEDQDGNLVPGVPVRFRVMEGGGALRGSIQTTDAGGVATVEAWKLGPQAGAQNTLQATSVKIPGDVVTFTVVAQP